MEQLPPQASHRIPLDKAKEMARRYLAKKKEILKPEYAGQNILIDCETFNRDAFDSILAQKDCAGIRIYFGMDENSSLRAIIVGVNSKNQNILPQSMVSPTPTASISADSLAGPDPDGYIAEDGVICPPNCPPPDPTFP